MPGSPTSPARQHARRGNFYTYFAGKEEVFHAVLQAVQDDMLHPGFGRHVDPDTSGTPKGSVTHARKPGRRSKVGREFLDARPDSVVVTTLPLFHVFRINAIMNVTVRARGLLTLVPRFDPAKVRSR